ncbi:hypothetical protein DFH08DRAFT_1073870, partial [Mycena albidolilacea]
SSKCSPSGHSILSASAPLPYWDEHCLCRWHVKPRQRSQAEAPSLFGCLFPNPRDTLPPARPPCPSSQTNEHQCSPHPLPRGGPLTWGGGTPAHSTPWSSCPPKTSRPRSPRRCSHLVTRILTRDHRRHLDNRHYAREFHPDLPCITLHAFLTDWLHPALAPCFDGLEIVWAYIFWLQLWRYPLCILNAKTLLRSAPDSAPNPLPYGSTAFHCPRSITPCTSTFTSAGLLCHATYPPDATQGTCAADKFSA